MVFLTTASKMPNSTLYIAKSTIVQLAVAHPI